MSNEDRNKNGADFFTPAEPQPAVESAPLTLSDQDILQAASGVLDLLSRETTLVPGSLRREVAVLDAVLRGLVTGQLLVVTAQQLAVESEAIGGAGKAAA